MLTSMREKIAGWISPGARSEARSWDYGLFPFLGGGGMGNSTLAGPAINERTALSIAAVWNAINIYANTIGALELEVVERDERGGRRPALDYPAYDLLNSRPNRISTSMRLRQALVGHVLTNGNGYLEIEWDARGRYPVGLHLMDPRDVTPTWTDDNRVVYRQGCGGPDLASEDVIHVAMFGWDGLRGYSPISVNRDTLAISAAQRTYQAGLFGNGLGMKGHLEVPGKLTTPQKSELRDNMNRLHQGPANAGNFGIIDNGGKWVQTSFSPQDAELILGCHFSVEEIARIFNLPQHMLGLLEHATFSNIEEQNIAFYQQSLMPFLVAIEQEFNNKLFGPVERYRYSIRHDVSTLLRGNTQAQREQEQADLASGVRSINEVRIARGYDPIDDPNADWHWIPTNNLQALEVMDSSPAASVVEATPDPVAKPGDATASEETLEAVRSAIADPLARMVRAECEAARKAATRDRFDLWADEFYPKHVARMTDAIAPPVRVLASLLGGAINPTNLAEEWAHGSRQALRGLYTTTPPDEMPAAVEKLTHHWQVERARSFVDQVACKSEVSG